MEELTMYYVDGVVMQMQIRLRRTEAAFQLHYFLGSGQLVLFFLVPVLVVANAGLT